MVNVEPCHKSHDRVGGAILSTESGPGAQEATQARGSNTRSNANVRSKIRINVRNKTRDNVKSDSQ